MDDSLTSFISEVCGDSHLRVEDNLGGGYVRLRSSEAERRQAQHDIRRSEDMIIEMLRNARDAQARHIFLAVSREGNLRKICMIDDGDGIPSEMHERVFESRVTSKLDTVHMDQWGVHGRGMALYSIKCNAETAQVLASAPGLGTAMIVESDVTKIKERGEQSAFPHIFYDEDGGVALKGPHNINRTTVEFSLTCKNSCEVYLGSPIEIAATLYSYGMATLSRAARTFVDDIEEVALIKRLSCVSDPDTFSRIAQSLGLEMSSRSARRILEGEIKALNEVTDYLLKASDAKKSKKTNSIDKPDKELFKDARGLKLHADDIGHFKQCIKSGYNDIARDYFLEPDVEPQIKVTQNEIVVRIPVSKLR